MFIVAACRESDGLMGLRNTLPWKRLSKDLQHFKRLTLDGTVIMGRKTFESIGSRPLIQRENLVLSRQGNVKTLDQALRMATRPNVAVIGGVIPFREALVHSECERVHLTLIVFPQQAPVELDETAVYFPLEELYSRFDKVDERVESESDFLLKFTTWKQK